MRKYFYCLAVVFVALIVAASIFFYPKKVHQQGDVGLPDSISLPYESQWNFRQSVNGCAPYSAAAVLRLKKDPTTSSADVDARISWRFRGYTFPFGIVQFLKSQGASPEQFIVEGTDAQKMTWLKAQLSQKQPVILWGRKSGLLHYVTLMGYEKGEFYIYDSLEEKGDPGMTIDKNGSRPGNATWSNAQLLDFWSRGGLLGLYRFYAIIIR